MFVFGLQTSSPHHRSSSSVPANRNLQQPWRISNNYFNKFFTVLIVILINCIVGNLCAWQDNVRPKLFVQLGEFFIVFWFSVSRLRYQVFDVWGLSRPHLLLGKIIAQNEIISHLIKYSPTQSRGNPYSWHFFRNQSYDVLCFLCVYSAIKTHEKFCLCQKVGRGGERDGRTARAHRKNYRKILCCFFSGGRRKSLWYYVFVFWHLNEILDAKREEEKDNAKEKRMENVVYDEFIINWRWQTQLKTSRFSRPWDGIVPSTSKWHYKNLIKRLRRVSWFHFKTLFHVNICSILLARVMSLRKMHRCVSTSTSNLSQLELI